MPYEPFLLGVGVVFTWLLVTLAEKRRGKTRESSLAALYVHVLIIMTGAESPLLPPSVIQKTPRVRKILVRNSGAGNGCANFMGA